MNEKTKKNAPGQKITIVTAILLEGKHTERGSILEVTLKGTVSPQFAAEMVGSGKAKYGEHKLPKLPARKTKGKSTAAPAAVDMEALRAQVAKEITPGIVELVKVAVLAEMATDAASVAGGNSTDNSQK